MFWNSVWQGLSAFSHWETWVAVVVYMIAVFAIAITGGMLIAKERAVLGMAWMFLLAPLFQILATLVVIMSLAPILFSLGDSASWQLPWVVMAERTWHTVVFVGATLLVLILLGAIGLGRLPGVTQFATGASATASTASLMAGVSPNLRAHDLELWPGLFVVIGFLVLAALLQSVVLALMSFVASSLEIDPEENEGASMLLIMPVSAAVMFLPTFMYAAFLAPQLAGF